MIQKKDLEQASTCSKKFKERFILLIFFAEGRLGNQLFQYMFLKTIQHRNEPILVNGFDDLKEVFENSDYLYLSNKNKVFRNIWKRLLKPIIKGLSKLNIISTINVRTDIIGNGYIRESDSYTTTPGLFSSIRFVELGFFQSEAFFDPLLARNLRIKNKYLTQGALALKNIPKNAAKTFVHIRLSDYKDFKINDRDTCLPLHYFLEQIVAISEKNNNSFFIFLSDEPEYAKKHFAHIQNSIITENNHYGVDFTIMTLCNNGILSPSSFGWWGSYLMKKRNFVFAPQYWLGFNSEIDFPTKPLAAYMHSIKIENKPRKFQI